MFRKRSGQKPDEVLIRDFQNKFGDVATTPYNPQTGIQPEQILPPNPNVPALPTFDPNPTLFPHNPAFVSSPLSRQGCSCTVFKSRMCAVLHSPAGDLHTPMHECDSALGPTSPWGPAFDGQQSGHAAFHTNDAYQLEYFRRPTFPWRSSNPFFQPPTHPPRSFMLNGPNPDLDPLEPLQETPFTEAKHSALHTQSSPFRYQVILHTPTATYNKECEIPVTYLNRRQAYKISVVDTIPPITSSPTVRYRTHIRICFDDDKQRADPLMAWKLWVDGRGLAEARETGGNLAAVEFVDTKPNSVDAAETFIELESSTVDGFCVAWTSDPQSGRLGCEMHVVFNFLSTDFSLSKGVKGAPVRLCAKTEVVSSEPGLQNQSSSVSEISCCKVKLFRDHGSERKITNDITQLKKAIQRVEESIAYSPTDGRSTSKRKRGKLPLVARGSESSVQQLAPTDLHNTQGPPGTDTLAVDEDPHKVLFVLRAMLSSSEPYSLLSLPCDERDDPDRFPLLFPNPLSNPLPTERSLVGTSFSSELGTDGQWGEVLQQSAEKKPQASGGTHTHLMTPWAATSIIPDTGKPSAVNRPLTTLNIPMRSRVGNHQRAVACFYVIRRTDGQHEAYHHAVYLVRRTLSEFIKQLSSIKNIPPESIIRVVHVNAAGLRILVDDNVVRETPEGQDMVAEFLPGDDTTAPASKWQVNLFY
ncbi:hypothetical protein P170DRAFT_429003 [Aspergillus steynii IBT 23096]|uniref:Grh/CP2 DB domain-containing protein n=1 Tax=Aspergillus steynii IBT 23096 TaxID=1392250 RepID=A0A2I2FYV7_9EURO|nr:uncharacterized protein P170DRAFT_429003 [Aspergillus steynii IBT 23096]PLB45823.1 hypothetical protein P170DRAFT_429003 [Aspergillus steynii IBT 23096]